MNDIYKETNNNEYTLFDENKEAYKITSNNDIDEILNLENDLEQLKKDLKKYKEKIKNIKTNEKIKKKFNKFMILAELAYIIFCLLMETALINFILSSALLSYVGLRVFITKICGTSNKNEKDKFEYSLKKNECNAKIDAYTNKLNKIKTESNFKKEKLINVLEKDTYVETLENTNSITEAPRVKKLVPNNKQPK